MPLDFEAAITDELAATKTLFTHDRLLTVGASEIGGCIRRVAYEKHGYPRDPLFRESRGAAQRGDLIEEHWTVPIVRRAVEKVGGQLIWAGKDGQKSIIHEKWKVSATPDGLAIDCPADTLVSYGGGMLGAPDKKHCWVPEMKSFDPRKSIEEMPTPQHLMQLQMQLGLINHDKTHEYKPRWGAVVYVDASFVDNIRVFPDFYRPHEFLSLIRRARSVYENKPEQHIAEGRIEGGKPCEYCPFEKQCKTVETARPKRNKPKSPFTLRQANDVQGAIGSILNQRERKKEAERRIKLAEAKLKQVLQSTDTYTVNMALKDGRSFVARWIQTPGNLTFDFGKMAEQLMEDGHDLEDFKKRGEPSTRLTVSVVDAHKGRPMLPRTEISPKRKRT